MTFHRLCLRSILLFARQSHQTLAVQHFDLDLTCNVISNLQTKFYTILEKFTHRAVNRYRTVEYIFSRSDY